MDKYLDRLGMRTIFMKKWRKKDGWVCLASAVLRK